MKPLNKVKIKWSPEFAYALGLLATDGNLSPDGRHFDFTSQDKEQLLNFMKCFGIKVKIGYKTSGYTGEKSSHIQFGDVVLYKFLLKIGFTPAKTKTISSLKIPGRYFFDFLRGHLDGDGCFYSYWDKRWRSSFMFYTVFLSASKNHINWIRRELLSRLGIKGHINANISKSVIELKYAKAESLKLLPKIYYDSGVVCLSRKREKIRKALKINKKQSSIYARVL
ncbi:MAG: hypothetical protein NTW60_03920 [Candidatus Wolfebacteria bacterium]|nr:hypothetical protein [Candidatus Wolfebacteria bacterium]